MPNYAKAQTNDTTGPKDPKSITVPAQSKIMGLILGMFSQLIFFAG
jgi:hypothetical protein